MARSFGQCGNAGTKRRVLLGHALGLKHGHETEVYGALPFGTDSMEYSVMTYRSYVGSDAQAVSASTWMRERMPLP